MSNKENTKECKRTNKSFTSTAATFPGNSKNLQELQQSSLRKHFFPPKKTLVMISCITATWWTGVEQIVTAISQAELPNLRLLAMVEVHQTNKKIS